MEISRYASRLAPNSSVLPSGRPLPSSKPEGKALADSPGAGGATSLPLQTRNSLPEEPEDAGLTGGTRSLSRRLLALNFPGLSLTPTPVIKRVSREASPEKPKARRTVLTKRSLVTQDA